MSTLKKGMRVDGLPRLRRELRRAGVDLGELKAANLAAANTVLPHAKIAVPVLTGAMKSTMRASGIASGGVIRAGYKKRVPYAPVIHFGWPKRQIRAQPWISRAVVRHEDEWVAVYMQHVNQIIKKL